MGLEEGIQPSIEQPLPETLIPLPDGSSFEPTPLPEPTEVVVPPEQKGIFNTLYRSLMRAKKGAPLPPTGPDEIRDAAQQWQAKSKKYESTELPDTLLDAAQAKLAAWIPAKNSVVAIVQIAGSDASITAETDLAAYATTKLGELRTLDAPELAVPTNHDKRVVQACVQQIEDVRSSTDSDSAETVQAPNSSKSTEFGDDGHEGYVSLIQLQKTMAKLQNGAQLDSTDEERISALTEVLGPHWQNGSTQNETATSRDTQPEAHEASTEHEPSSERQYPRHEQDIENTVFNLSRLGDEELSLDEINDTVAQYIRTRAPFLDQDAHDRIVQSVTDRLDISTPDQTTTPVPDEIPITPNTEKAEHHVADAVLRRIALNGDGDATVDSINEEVQRYIIEYQPDALRNDSDERIVENISSRLKQRIERQSPQVAKRENHIADTIFKRIALGGNANETADSIHEEVQSYISQYGGDELTSGSSERIVADIAARLEAREVRRRERQNVQDAESPDTAAYSHSETQNQSLSSLNEQLEQGWQHTGNIEAAQTDNQEIDESTVPDNGNNDSSQHTLSSLNEQLGQGWQHTSNITETNENTSTSNVVQEDTSAEAQDEALPPNLIKAENHVADTVFKRIALGGNDEEATTDSIAQEVQRYLIERQPDNLRNDSDDRIVENISTRLKQRIKRRLPPQTAKAESHVADTIFRRIALGGDDDEATTDSIAQEVEEYIAQYTNEDLRTDSSDRIAEDIATRLEARRQRRNKNK